MEYRAIADASAPDGQGEAWARGLTSAEARERLKRDGPNRLRTARPRSALSILLAQFRSLIVLILVAAAAFSVVLGDHVEAAAVAAVLVLNTAIGFASELRGVRSMQALRRLAATRACVVREGRMLTIPTEDLVVGDTVRLASGEVVPADLRIVAANALQCDESALTGESVPVDKTTDPVPRNRPLSERSDSAFKGTAVTRGTGTGVVLATGMATELGAIAEMAQAARPQSSPLLRQLDRLGGQLIGITMALTLLLAGLGTWVGYPPLDMLKVAVALAVAAVPEGLPVVATLILARGMWRMAAQNAVVKTLAAVETLGATTLILTDKTGTLTENRMALAELALSDGDYRLDHEACRLDPGLAFALTIAALGSDGDEGGHGVDPIDAALLVAAQAAGCERPKLLDTYPHVHVLPFSHETAMTVSIHRDASGYLFAIKGAPEAVIAAATRIRGDEGDRPLDASARPRWLDRNAAMARRGLRVVALALKRAATPDAAPHSDLTLVGLAGLADPAREGVREAILAARAAGVRVVMVTGDHRETARAIGRDVGLLDTGTEILDATDIEALEREGADPDARLLGAAAFSRVDPPPSSGSPSCSSNVAKSSP